jgi:hypothetical protein
MGQRLSNLNIKIAEYVPVSKKKTNSDLKKCNTEEFIKTGNIEELKDCYYIFPDIKPQKIFCPLDTTNQSCYLINNKRIDYYIYKYEPSKIIDNINKFDIDDATKEEYISNISEIADLTPRDNCCNCISFTFYTMYYQSLFDAWINYDDYSPDIVTYLYTVYAYLLSIKISVTNITRCLPNFISRVYLDISVFKILYEVTKIVDIYNFRNNRIETLLNKNIEIIEFLFNNASTEVYTIIDNESEISKTRSYRFLTMIEKDVNIKVFREADGIVSYMDCINIQKFVNANTIMLVYDLNEKDNFINLLQLKKIKNLQNDFIPYKEDGFMHSPHVIRSVRYSLWLKEEQSKLENLEKEYFKTHIIGFDLYAGCLAISLQIKSEKYYECTNEIKKYVNNYSFDERLLINLFLKLISVKCNESNTNNDALKIKTQEDLNYVLFFLNNFSYIDTDLYINEKTDISGNKAATRLLKIENDKIENIFILILENCRRFINEKNIRQIKNYYNNLKLFLEENKLSYWLDDDIRAIIFLLFIDILFQNNEQILKKEIIDSNILLPMIYIIHDGFIYYKNNKSINLINEFLIEYEKLVIYLYITNPLEIISDEIYSGGDYYEKYMKYKHKYIQLKAENNYV